MIPPIEPSIKYIAKAMIVPIIMMTTVIIPESPLNDMFEIAVVIVVDIVLPADNTITINV